MRGRKSTEIRLGPDIGRVAGLEARAMIGQAESAVAARRHRLDQAALLGRRTPSGVSRERETEAGSREHARQPQRSPRR